MGGKSQDNSAMIEEQEKQADAARAKEVDRQLRIDKGLAGIKSAFEGAPVYGANTVQNVTLGGDTLPAGYVYGEGKEHDNRKGNAGEKIVIGPDGTYYRTGETVSASMPTDTGTTSGGGFDDAFYDKFRQSMLDYYMPQVDTQYGEAKDDLTYGLARAGTSKSSAAVDEAAKLAEQNELNRANVISTADTGAADLRSRVASERAAAEAQLYATENPEVAASQALAAVKNISLAQPDLSPLGSVFETALVGGANALTGYKNEKTKQSIPGYTAAANKVVYS